MTKLSNREIKKQKLARVIELKVQTCYDITGLVGVNINQFTNEFLDRQLEFYKREFPELTEYD